MMKTTTETPTTKLFFEASHDIMIYPYTEDKYLLIDRKHYLECKDKDLVNCDMFSMNRLTIKEDDNTFGAFDNIIKVKINSKFLTLEYERQEINCWKLINKTTLKEVLKLNKHDGYYEVRLTPFWYEQLTKLELLK